MNAKCSIHLKNNLTYKEKGWGAILKHFKNIYDYMVNIKHKE